MISSDGAKIITELPAAAQWQYVVFLAGSEMQEPVSPSEKALIEWYDLNYPCVVVRLIVRVQELELKEYAFAEVQRGW